MDIKQSKPGLVQEASAALNQTAISLDSPSFMAQFSIRTMAGDLGKENQTDKNLSLATAPAAQTIKEPPTAAMPPSLARQDKEKEAAQKKLAQEKLAQDHREQELSHLLEQVKSKLAAKEFSAALFDTQKIMNDPEAGWLIKWQAKRLSSKIAEAEKISQEPIAPPPAPPKPTPAPRDEKLYAAAPPSGPPAPAPINLPTVDAPVPLIKPDLPPAPLPPVAPSKPITIQTEIVETKEEIDVKKVAIVGLTSIFVLALIIGGLWFFLGQSPETIVQISPSPYLSPQPSASTPTPPVAPPALFKADSQKIFGLRAGQEKTDFQETIARLIKAEEPAGHFVHFLFKDSQNNFPSLASLASLTESDLFDLPTQSPAGPLKNQLDLNRFSFFAYSQTQANASPFIVATSSGRLGLIIAVRASASSTEELSRSLKDLEQLMLPGLKILLSDAKIAWPVKPIFLDNLYRQVAIRYINLPEPDFSLDYAILNDQLIFATSKESMYAIIDRLVEFSPTAQ